MKLFTENKIFSHELRHINRFITTMEVFICMGYIIGWSLGLWLSDIPQGLRFNLINFLGLSVLGLRYLLAGMGIFTYMRIHSLGLFEHPLTFPTGFCALITFTVVAVFSYIQRDFTIVAVLIPGQILGTTVGMLWVQAIGIKLGRLNALYNICAIKGAWKIVMARKNNLIP